MEVQKKENTVTVQGVMAPVPADFGGEQAGPLPSLSSDRSASSVSNLADDAYKATSFEMRREKREATGNPFTKSSKLYRSPEKWSETQVTKCGGVQEIESEKQNASSASPAASGTRMAVMNKLGKVIDSLNEYVKPRNNIHQEIRKLLRMATLAFAELRVEAMEQVTEELPPEQDKARLKQDERTKITNKLSATVSTQTELYDKTRARVKMADVLRTPTSASSSARTESPKRRRDNGERPSGHTPEQKRGKKDGASRTPMHQAPLCKNGNVERDTESTETNQEWHTVATKKRNRSKIPKRTRPEALVVGTTGNMSYADILRKVKTDPNLKVLGDNVTRIRRTQKGEMLFELNRGVQNKGSEFQALVREALKDQAEVRSLTQQVVIECVDMDEVTTKEDICSALEIQFGLSKLDITVVRSLRRAYGGTQAAEITLPHETAKKLLDRGSVRIGWTVCKLKVTLKPKRCYRCLEYGHMARDCKNNDRSGLCWRCGEDGHQAKTCKRDQKCFLCSGDANIPRDHIAGGFKCPKYRSALNAVRRCE